MKLIRHIAVFVIVVFGMLNLADLYFDLNRYQLVSSGLIIYFLFRIIVGLGKRIVLLEIIAFIAVLEILFVPVLHYIFYNGIMPIYENDYFNYALPATTGFVSCLDYFSRQIPEQSLYFNRLRKHLGEDPRLGYVLISIGVIGFVGLSFAPFTLKTLFYLLYYFLFPGVLCLIFSESKLKTYALLGTGFILSYSTVQQGMFGSLFFWIMLSVVMILAGIHYKLSMLAKVSIIIIGFLLAILVQSIKFDYRRSTWGVHTSERQGDATLMGSLIIDRLNNWEKLFDPMTLIISSSRYNQGYYIGQTMDYVPRREPFANGEVLLDFIVPVIPRFLWSDKPLSNGRANVHRFTSTILEDGNTVDISPIGEGYANFGRLGGVLFSCMYALLLGSIFCLTFKIANERPSIIIWLPKLFFTCLTMETSIFAAWGSMFQSIILIFLLYWLLELFGVNLWMDTAVDQDL